LATLTLTRSLSVIFARKNFVGQEGPEVQKGKGSKKKKTKTAGPERIGEIGVR